MQTGPVQNRQVSGTKDKKAAEVRQQVRLNRNKVKTITKAGSSRNEKTGDYYKIKHETMNKQQDYKLKHK